jgi:oligoendopeptidase F
MMNFDITLNSMATVAHEMGHALNDYYVNQNEPYIYHDYTLFTAEVASTCNEALITKYLIENAKSREEKIILLEQYIRQIDGAFFTQTMFSEFEQTIHDHVQNGGATSVDYFRETYRDIYQKYHGPDLYIGPDNDMSGMKIYHFYRTFYVYQYATGYAAAQALSKNILDNGDEALEAYLQFLGTGASKYPIDMLRDAGVDLTSPEPFEKTINIFSELVDELERLLEEG